MKNKKILKIIREAVAILWGVVIGHRTTLALKRPLSYADLFIYFVLIATFIFIIMLTLPSKEKFMKLRERIIMKLLLRTIIYGIIVTLFETFLLNPLFY